MNDDLYERIEELEDAQGLLAETIDLIKRAVRGTHLEDAAHAYIIPSLRMSLDNQHCYLGSQPYNLAELIHYLEESELEAAQ